MTMQIRHQPPTNHDISLPAKLKRRPHPLLELVAYATLISVLAFMLLSSPSMVAFIAIAVIGLGSLAFAPIVMVDMVYRIIERL